MVRRPADFTSALPWPVFTRADALRAGIHSDRLRRPDLVRLRRGLYARRGVEVTEVDIAAALCRHDPAVVIVGLSAARMLRIPMPHRFERWDRRTPVEVASLTSRGRSDSVVTWHDLSLSQAEVLPMIYHLRGSGDESAMSMTTRVRTWRDLARHLELPELIAAGDHLVRMPRPGLEGRDRPWCTPEALFTAATGRHARALRLAAAQVRIGADSPKETTLRLAFVAAGLPEPRINVPLVGADGRERHSPDFQWTEFGLCAEYEGTTHNDPEQIQRDIGRARTAKAAGFTEIRLAKKDLEDGCAPAVQIIRNELNARGWHRAS